MSVTRKAVTVISLGRMGFMAAFDVQSRYARKHLDQMSGKPNAEGQNTLLLVEHPPVYTVGIRDKHISRGEIARLKKTGAEFYQTNRGGLVTFHGPGQLVAYPILNLTQFKPSIKWYVEQLEKTLLGTLSRFDLEGQTTDQTGVWVGDRKIASIGLHGSRYVSTHGVSLNSNTDLSWFEHIVPCGLEGVEMTSLTNELDQEVSVQDTIKPFLRSFQETFDCDLEYRLLDQEELRLMEVEPSQNVGDIEGKILSSFSGSGPISAEGSVRCMSTSASVKGITIKELPKPRSRLSVRAKATPMW